ncbi:MAG: T9SS type A sorting domain-containing protein [Bacteroidales bacterium]|nr:T9SS type A sorting domain-containing protein [Bacteroidales bacterium]
MKKFLSLLLTLTLCTIVSAQAPWKTNILTNGSAESGNFDGWTKTSNGGSGWAIGGGPEGTSTFMSSYSNCVLTQDIDLEAKGFSATELDGGCKALLQGYACGGTAGSRSGVMKMIVYLLDADKNILETITMVDITYTSPAPEWKAYDKQTTLPAGTRYVRYQITGKDALFWAGQYGPNFTGMAVRLYQPNDGITFSVTNEIFSNGTVKWMGVTEMDPSGDSPLIEVSPKTQVSFTVTPDAGCELARCYVKSALGKVAVTENGTTLSFTMPSSDVIIAPVFEKTEVPSISEDGYYNIYNENTLKWFSNQVNKGNNTIKGRLMNDIDMAGKPFSPIGVGTVLDYNVSTLSQKGFAGIFDGQGYTISNLTIGAVSGELVTGFIGNLSGTIKNTIFDNCHYDQVDQDVRMGIVAGVVQPGAVVENCGVINSTINVAGHIGAAVAGGNYGGTIRYCYTFNNTVNAHGRAGYLVGDNTNDANSLIGTITDCISDNKIEGTTSDAHKGTVTNCTANSTLKLDDGSLAYAMYERNTAWRQEIGVDAYPRPNVNGPRVYMAQCVSNKYSNNSWAEHGHVYGADGNCSLCGAAGCAQVNGVFQIANKADLDFFSNYVNTTNSSAKAVLVADIVYNDNLFGKITLDSVNVATVNEEGTVSTWQPIANVNNFTGSFDGQGHSITGLYTNESSPAGLFSLTGGGSTIANVVIKDSYIRGTICGGIVAKTDGSTITNCAVENSYVVGSQSAGTGGIIGNSASVNTVIQLCYNTSTIFSSKSDVGGILGYGYATIKNCYNQGSAHGSDDTGGIAGELRGGSAAYNCYNSGDITCGSSYVGGIVAFTPSANSVTATFSNCYSVMTPKKGTQKSVEAFASGEVTYLLNDGQNGDVWFQEIGTDAFPHFNETENNKVYLSNSTYTNTPTDDFLYGGGTGSKNYPFIIKTRAHLEKLATKVNSGITYSGYYFIVANDIDLTTEPWTPIGRFTSATDIKPFSGYFDGGNHVIDHLTIQSTQGGAAGLFAMVLAGELRNIILTNVNIERPVNGDIYSFAGAVVARANYAIVENCEARSGIITTGSSNVNGGVAGAFAGGTMRNCINRIDVISSTGANTSYNAGIVGRIEPGIDWRGYTNPYASRWESYIEDCRNYGNITSSGSYLGGIAGTFTTGFTSSYKGYVLRCANAGTITGNGACGGIVGELSSYSEVNYNVNIGSIRNFSNASTAYRYGGIVGSVNYDNTGVYGNLNAGNITMPASVNETGGIVGCVGYESQNYYYNAVQRNLNVAYVSSKGNYVGTLIGRNSKSIRIGGGITNSQVKVHANSGSESDAITSSSSWGWGGFIELPTVGIAGLRQRGSQQLGNQDEYFHFEEGRYPCPKGIEMSDIVRVATTPINLNEGEIYNTAGSKSTSFAYNTDVEFSTKNGYVNFADGTATYEGAGEDVIYITYGDAQRYLDVVIAWNKSRKLTVNSAQDLADLAAGVNAGAASGFRYHGTTLPRYAAGCVFVQTCDIKRGVHTPIGNTTNGFRGTYDGDGHKITGLIYNDSGSGVGLFGAAYDGAIIKNLSIDGSITALNTAAGFVGFAFSGSLTIENCSNNVIVNTTSNTGSGTAAFVGNAVNANVTIRNCYNSAQITSSADGYLAAIANKPDNATGVLVIENVHNYGTISGVLKEDGNAFANNATKMTNCYINITKTTLNTVATGLTRAPETDFNNGKVCWMLNGKQETRSQCENVLFTQNLDPQTGELWPVFNSLYVYPNGTDAFTNIRPDGEYTLSEYIVYDITNSPKDTLFPVANLLAFASEGVTWIVNKEPEYLHVDTVINGYAYVTSKTDTLHAGWLGAEVITFSTTMQDADGTIIQIDVPIKYEKKFISPDASTELKVKLETLRTVGTPDDLFRVVATVIGRREGYSWSIVKKGTSEEYTNVTLSQTTMGQDFKIPDVGDYTLTFIATSTDGTFSASKELSVIGISNRTPQVCYGDSITLETSGADFSDWKNGPSSSSITVSPTKTTTYVVEMSKLSAGTSTFTDSVTVIVSEPVSTTPNSCLHVGNTMEIEALGDYETYSWSTGETTSSISVSEAGIYTVETLDALGCTSSASTEISVYGITTTDLAICYGEGITLNAAASMDSVVWNDAYKTHGETATINYMLETQSVSATSYKNGVPYLDAVTVVVGEPVSFNDVRAICTGVTTTITPIADYATYSWDNGDGTEVISTQKSIVVSEANTYRLTATDTLGCESSQSVVLNVVPNPVVDLGEDRNICYGDTIVFDAGAGFMKYNWSATRDFETAETDQTFIADTILMQTIQGLGNERKLSVEVHDKFGCSNSDTVVLTFHSRPTITFGEGGLYCGEEESVAPTFTVSGVAPFRFTYTDGIEQFTEDFSGKTFTPTAPGIGEYTYRMNALEDAYCSADTTSQTTIVKVVALPTVELGADTTLCYGESFTLNVHNDGATYSWLPLRDGVHAELKDSYIVDTAIVNHNFPISNIQEIVATVTSAEGCVVKDTVMVTFKERPTVSITGSKTYCGLDEAQGATFNLKGTAPFTFTYTDGEETMNIDSLETASLQAQKPTAIGVYDYSILSLKDATCTADLQIGKARVVVAEIPEVVLGNDTTLCYGEELTLQLNAEEGASYAWSPRRDGIHITTSASFIVDTAIVNNNFPISNVQEIVATKTTSNGCSASDTMTVTFKERPTATISGSATYCGTEEVEGATISLKGTAPFTFAYTDGIDTTTIASQEEAMHQTAAPSSVGTYNYSIVSLKDAYCSADYQSSKAKVVVAEIPTVSLGNDTTVCYGESVVLNAGFEAKWYTNGNYVSRSSAMEADTALIYAYYPNKNEQEIIAVVSNADGCSASDTMTVTFKERPSATISGGATYCGTEDVDGATISLNGTAPFTLAYTDGIDTTNIESQEEATLQTTAPSSIGTYNYSIVSLKDAYCSANRQNAKARIVVADIPAINIGADTTLCYGETLALNAGNAESYEWRANGAIIGNASSLNVDENLVFNYWPIVYNKEIVATIANENGCKNSDTLVVSFRSRPTATVSGSKLYCGNDEVQPVSFQFDGVAPFTFTYNDGEQSFTETVEEKEFVLDLPQSEGVYSYRLTSLGDAECSETTYGLATSITIAAMPSVNLGEDQVLCKGELAYLDAQTEEENSCVWFRQSKKNPISVNSSIFFGETDTVTVKVTSPSGCIAYDTVSITIKKPYAEQLGVVTYSENAKDMVIAWEKTVDVGTVGYIVERETDYTNNWVAVDDTIFFNQPALVVDYNIPATRAYKYRLRTIDECGNSAVSKPHRSMHLSIQKQIDDKPSLNWNAYEPTELVSQYLVLRGADSTAMDTIDRVPASNMTETWDEIESFEGKMYYKVLFVLENEVNENCYRDIYGNKVDCASIKAESGPFSLAVSNIAEVENEIEPAAVEDVLNAVVVYAVNHTINVKNAKDKAITVYDNTGRVISHTSSADEVIQSFDVRLQGVYFVKVEDTSYTVIVK